MDQGVQNSANKEDYGNQTKMQLLTLFKIEIYRLGDY